MGRLRSKLKILRARRARKFAPIYLLGDDSRRFWGSFNFQQLVFIRVEDDLYLRISASGSFFVRSICGEFSDVLTLEKFWVPVEISRGPRCGGPT